MHKRFVSLLMLYSALAIMLGHNFIGHHHHHDFEQNELSHHHSDGHHHDHGTEDESNDWEHFFSYLQHGVEGLKFLIGHSSPVQFSKQIPQFTALQTSYSVFKQVIIVIRQNDPPYIADYYNPQNFLPSGLRGPPCFIV